MAEPNILFNLATRVINHTSRNLFLTGRAGTGKTTFLRHIQNTTPKKTVVVAPTGVAAINAGGVTMHSFFQLPLGMYIADAGNYFGDEYSGQLVVNRHSLFKNMRLNKDKIALMRELELVIIDEVSMLRADALDAIDTILRHFRRNPRMPFGGVQMLFIGDLFQLPPVITNAESQLFYEHYKSPFFFDARVMLEEQPLVIELKHIYRQRDEQFIQILNAIRNNNVGEEELNILHQQYKPWEQPEDGVIVLTTHNYKADAINTQRLEALPERTHKFEAIVKGEFYEKALPAERSLQLKIGAQIMFIKNDVGETRRYYNGKLAKVYHIGEEGDIWVKLADSNEELKLEQHTWKSIKYKYNQDKDEVDEEELGSFMQYPVRLAWAITIHKSQGLTFERAIVDAGQSFAAGQVYVALSRLTSLQGMVLHSKIAAQGIEMPEVVIEFCRREMGEERLKSLILNEEHAFAQEQLMHWFSLEKLMFTWAMHHEGYIGKGIPGVELAIAWSKEVADALSALEKTASNFRNQLGNLIHPQPDYVAINSRILAAKDWFDRALEADVLEPLSKHFKEWSVKPRSKKYLTELRTLEAAVLIVKRGWQQAQQLTAGLSGGAMVTDINFSDTPIPESRLATIEVAAVPKPKVGETYLITLSMYQQGKSIEKITKERGMSAGTIEGHLARFIPSGEVKLKDLVPVDKIILITNALQDAPENATMTVIKEQLPADVTYGMMRLVEASLPKKKVDLLKDLPY